MDSKQRVNIAIVTTSGGHREVEQAGTWLLEMTTPYHASTGLNPEYKQGYLYRKKISCLELSIQLLANAVYTLNKYEQEWGSIEVYTSAPVIPSALMGRWIDKWSANDWHTAKGEEVKYKASWQQLFSQISARTDRFIVSPYRYNRENYMKDQAERYMLTQKKLIAQKARLAEKAEKEIEEQKKKEVEEYV